VPAGFQKIALSRRKEIGAILNDLQRIEIWWNQQGFGTTDDIADVSTSAESAGTSNLFARADHVHLLDLTDAALLEAVDDEVAGLLQNASGVVWTYDDEAGTLTPAVDHGGLGGLTDDDHEQYLLANATRGVSANWDIGDYQLRAKQFYSDTDGVTGGLLGGASGDVQWFRSGVNTWGTVNDVVIGGTPTTTPYDLEVWSKARLISQSGDTYLIIRRESADEWYPSMIFQKTRASSAICQSGDWLGEFSFAGSDGSTTRTAAWIRAAVDGTPGASDMPGRLSFATTPDGSVTPVERVRINNVGNTSLGTHSLLFGTFGSEDVNLYRSAANVLKTDDAFDAALGFKDAGVPGIDTTFLDQDGNTITVSGGIVTAKTAP